MSTYQRTETVEAMQWDGRKSKHESSGWGGPTADEIVAWVNANGGEARYESVVSITGCSCNDCQHPARIGVRQPRGHWIYAAPSDWIVMKLAGSKIVTQHGLVPSADLSRLDVQYDFTVVSAADWAAAGWQLT